MELTAVLELLANSDPERPVRILADSKYVIDSLTKWIHGWRRKGWRTAKGGLVANRELIEAIALAMEGRKVVFEWVRGHEGHALNEAADRKARGVATQIQSKLR
jgi:ribonuclease HI